jgi:hypothetical protein
MVESSRLGRAGSVCLQQLSSRSNKSSSRLGFATQPPRISLLARDGDARRIVRARSEFHLVTFLLVITGKRSTLFVEIQGPVCVDGLVLRSRSAGQCSSGCRRDTPRLWWPILGLLLGTQAEEWELEFGLRLGSSPRALTAYACALRSVPVCDDRSAEDL